MTIFCYRNPKTETYHTSKKHPVAPMQYIDQGETAKMRKLATRLNRPVSNPVFGLLLEASKPILEHYHCDLYRSDRVFLEEHNPKTFIWSVRDTGTHFCAGFAPDWDKAILDGFGRDNRSAVWFLFHNGKLTKTENPVEDYKKHVASKIRSYKLNFGEVFSQRYDYWEKMKTSTIRTVQSVQALVSCYSADLEAPLLSIVSNNETVWKAE